MSCRIRLRPRSWLNCCGLASLLMCVAAPLSAAELKPATIAAFERYQRAAESAIQADLIAPDRYLRIFTVPDAKRSDVERELRLGQVAILRVAITDRGKSIDVPDGMIHHWIGDIFMPGVHVNTAVALLQDYDKHAEVFRPAVERSNTLERDGDRIRLFLRFYFKKVIAVTVNTESTALFTTGGPDRVSSAIRSTRIAEVESPGTSREREKPVGRDGGYLWRLNTYWRFLERDGGTYVECESITLTRGIPLGFGWLVGPFVTSIPRDLLTATLETTRKTLVK